MAEHGEGQETEGLNRDVSERYWWWNAIDLLDFFSMVTKEGAENLRVEFHPRDEGKELSLVDKRTGEPCGHYDESHTCPPDCN